MRVTTRWKTIWTVQCSGKPHSLKVQLYSNDQVQSNLIWAIYFGNDGIICNSMMELCTIIKCLLKIYFVMILSLLFSGMLQSAWSTASSTGRLTSGLLEWPCMSSSHTVIPHAVLCRWVASRCFSLVSKTLSQWTPASSLHFGDAVWPFAKTRPPLLLSLCPISNGALAPHVLTEWKIHRGPKRTLTTRRQIRRSRLLLVWNT